MQNVSLPSLISKSDFLSSIWLLWTGKKLTPNVHTVLEACLTACLDHGTEPPSAQVTRITASCGKSLADSVAAGLLTLGPRHGNAGGELSAWIRKAIESDLSIDEAVDEAMSRWTRIPGFGHPVYTIDPRTTALTKIARAHLKTIPHLTFALNMSKELTTRKQKPLSLNIDGAVAAIMADLDVPAEFTDALFIGARTFGLLAHAMDEMKTAKTYRRGH